MSGLLRLDDDENPVDVVPSRFLRFAGLASRELSSRFEMTLIGLCSRALGLASVMLGLGSRDFSLPLVTRYGASEYLLSTGLGSRDLG
jgi:hypothetical protein